MAEVLGTLDTRGWLKDPAQKADALMAYSFVNNNSQSNMYQGMIMSLPWYIQQYPNDMVGLARALEDGYTRLFDPYYDSVTTTVNCTPGAENRGGGEFVFDIGVSILVVQEGRQYTLSQLLNIVNNRLTKVTPLNRS